MFGLESNKAPTDIMTIPSNSEVRVSFRYTITKDYINQSWAFKPCPRILPAPINIQNVEQYITKKK